MMSRTEMSTNLRSSTICSLVKQFASPVTAPTMSAALTPANIGRSALTWTSRPPVCTLTLFPDVPRLTHFFMAAMRSTDGFALGVASAAVRSSVPIALAAEAGRLFFETPSEKNQKRVNAFDI